VGKLVEDWLVLCRHRPRARLTVGQIGRCRLAQKRFDEAAKELLVVPFTYDYPDHAAAALFEAGQAHLEAGKPADAAKLWQGVIKDFASSPWAEVAQQRLSGIKR